mgnify:CR=1 FL=1
MPAVRTLHPAQGPPVPRKPRVAYAPQLVSPKGAASFLADAYPQQRPLRLHQVAYLQTLMRLGVFRQPTEIHYAQVGAQRYLVNGQHTLTALSRMQRPLWLTVVTLTVASLDEVDALYRTFDRGLQRSWRDMYRALHTEAAPVLLPRQLSLLGSAMSLAALGGDMYGPGESFAHAPLQEALRTPAVRLALMADWEADAANLFAGLHGQKGHLHLLYRAAVMAVALLTYRWQPEKAHLFWPAVARDNGLTEGMPEKALLRYLQETPARSKLSSAYCRAVASCWNAFYDHREMRQVRGRTVTQPLFLMGTPHDGARHYVYITLAGEVLRRPVAVAPGALEARGDGDADAE